MVWFKILTKVFQQVLLGFSAYEFGKNTEIVSQQAIVPQQSVSFREANKVAESFDIDYGFWLLTLIAVAVIAFVVREILKCFNSRRSDLIEMTTRNNNQNNNNNGVNANV